MTIGEGWNVDGLVNQKLCLSSQLPLFNTGLVQRQHYCWRCTNPPVCLMSHFTLSHETRPWDTWILLGWEWVTATSKGSNQLFSGRKPWPQTWRCWLWSQPLHIWLQSTPLHAEGQGQIPIITPPSNPARVNIVPSGPSFQGEDRICTASPGSEVQQLDKLPFQQPAINFPREAEQCDTPIIGAHPPVPLFNKGNTYREGLGLFWKYNKLGQHLTITFPKKICYNARPRKVDNFHIWEPQKINFLLEKLV